MSPQRRERERPACDLARRARLQEQVEAALEAGRLDEPGRYVVEFEHREPHGPTQVGPFGSRREAIEYVESLPLVNAVWNVAPLAVPDAEAERAAVDETQALFAEVASVLDQAPEAVLRQPRAIGPVDASPEVQAAHEAAALKAVLVRAACRPPCPGYREPHLDLHAACERRALRAEKVLASTDDGCTLTHIWMDGIPMCESCGRTKRA